MNNITSNISSLANPTLVKLATSQAKSKLLNVPIVSRADEIKNRIETLVRNKVATEKEYGLKNEKLFKDFAEGYITEEERDKKYDQFNEQRQEEVKLQDEEINKLKEDLANLQTDVLKEYKKNKKRLKLSINNSIKKSKKAKNKANKQRNLKVIKNIQKEIAPIIISQLANIITFIVERNSRLQELVDKTNEIIVAADTLEKINRARVARNNALTILNTQENRIAKVKRIVNVIQKIITILQIIIRVIQIILKLGSPIPIPLPVKIKLQPILQKILKILGELSVALTVVNSVLSNLIDYIRDLRLQLKNLGKIIDLKTTNPSISDDDLNAFISGLSIEPNLESYKGFKFAIREENGPNAVVVRGYKRRYAVAIDTNNVEVLKSDYSFTQDPQDLIDTLKIIIDQENLIA